MHAVLGRQWEAVCLSLVNESALFSGTFLTTGEVDLSMLIKNVLPKKMKKKEGLCHKICWIHKIVK